MKLRNLIPNELKFIDEIYAVGGCVRDALICRDITDIDLTTPYKPDEIITLLNSKHIKTIDVGKGKAHGTVIAVINGINYEITTFRKDISPDGRHSRVEFVDDLYEDLARRDCTINAIACDKLGNIIDPFHGVNDIKQKIIRSVGDSYERIKEDWLRVFRYLRFSDVLNYRLHKDIHDTLIMFNSIIVSNIFEKISTERIISEIDKNFKQSRHSGNFIELLKKYNLLRVVLPEFIHSETLYQNPKYHPEGDVWFHTIEVVNNIKTPELKWAGLLHDVGKTLLYEYDSTKSFYTFRGHDTAGAKMCKYICRRLKFSNKRSELIINLVRHHMSPLQLTNTKKLSKKAIRRFQFKVKDFMDELKELTIADTGNRSDINLEIFNPMDIPIEPLIKGRDLIKLGMKSGIEMGKLLKKLYDAQIDNNITNKSDLYKQIKEYQINKKEGN